MSSNLLIIIRDIAVILLLAAGTVLCVVLAVAITRIIPSLRRSAMNLERATGSAAEAGPNIVATSENVREISGNLLGASKDVSETTPLFREVAVNMEKFTASAAEAGPGLVEVSENIKETTVHLRSAAADVAGATPVLRLLGPAGTAANIANTGLDRLAGFVRGLFRR